MKITSCNSILFIGFFLVLILVSIVPAFSQFRYELLNNKAITGYFISRNDSCIIIRDQDGIIHSLHKYSIFSSKELLSDILMNNGVDYSLHIYKDDSLKIFVIIDDKKVFIEKKDILQYKVKAEIIRKYPSLGLIYRGLFGGISLLFGYHTFDNIYFALQGGYGPNSCYGFQFNAGYTLLNTSCCESNISLGWNISNRYDTHYNVGGLFLDLNIHSLYFQVGFIEGLKESVSQKVMYHLGIVYRFN